MKNKLGIYSANRAAVKTKCRALHVGLSEPRFHLYLHFLAPQLNVLAMLNKWLQNSELSLHVVYSKINAITLAFIEPVVTDLSVSIFEESNRKEVKDIIDSLPGVELQ